MNIRSISKAVAAGLAGAVTGVGTAAVVIPADVETPWWGFVVVALVNAGLAAAAVYWSPANVPAGAK